MFVGVELRRVVTADIHKNAFIIHVLHIHFWMVVNVRMHCYVRSWKYLLDRLIRAVVSGSKFVKKEQKKRNRLIHTNCHFSEESKRKLRALFEILSAIPLSGSWKQFCVTGPFPKRYLKNLVNIGFRKRLKRHLIEPFWAKKFYFQIELGGT